MGGGGDFTIIVTRKEVVAGWLPMLLHWLPLSNLDLVMTPVYVSMFFCYKRTHQSVNGGDGFTFGSMVGVLKKVVVQALSSTMLLQGLLLL